MAAFAHACDHNPAGAMQHLLHGCAEVVVDAVGQGCHGRSFNLQGFTGQGQSGLVIKRVDLGHGAIIREGAAWRGWVGV
jgi:hypothetical protein